MTKSTAAQQAEAALQTLAAPKRKPTKIDQFRTLLPTIEATIAKDVEHSLIIATLAKSGLHMTESQFRNALCRERKRLKAKDEKRQTPTRAPPAPPKATTRLAATAPTAAPASSNPADHRNSHDKPVKW